MTIQTLDEQILLGQLLRFKNCVVADLSISDLKLALKAKIDYQNYSDTRIERAQVERVETNAKILELIESIRVTEYELIEEVLDQYEWNDDRSDACKILHYMSGLGHRQHHKHFGGPEAVSLFNRLSILIGPLRGLQQRLERLTSELSTHEYEATHPRYPQCGSNGVSGQMLPCTKERGHHEEQHRHGV